MKRVGRHYGLSIECPHCGDRPGPDIKQWNRWRWLTAHVVLRHSAKGGTIDMTMVKKRDALKS